MTEESTIDPMRESVLKTLCESPAALFEDVMNAWARQRGRPATGAEVDRLWAIYSDASPTLIAPRPARQEASRAPEPEPTRPPNAPLSEASETVSAPSDLPELRAPAQHSPAEHPRMPGSTGETTGRRGSQLALPPSAPWPPRVVALLIDGAILAVVGQILGLIFAEPLYAAGPYGRWLGLVIVLAYVGVGTSDLAGGQTIGMRFFGIAVRGERGQPIGLLRALGRAAFIAAPTMASGLTALGVGGSPLATAIQSAIVLGLGIGGIAFAVGNRRRYQALHDVLCDTRVVRLSASPVATYPGTPRTIVTRVLPLAVVLTTLAASSLALGAAIRSNNETYRDLENDLAADPQLINVTASLGTSDSSPSATKWLELEVWHRGSISAEERQGLTADLARMTFDRVGDIDAVQVTITQGFDIGIARRSTSWTSAIAAANLP